MRKPSKVVKEIFSQKGLATATNIAESSLCKKVTVRNAKNSSDVVNPIVAVKQHDTEVHITGDVRWLDQDDAEYNWLSRLGDGRWSVRENAWVIKLHTNAEAEDLVQDATDLMEELGYECAD